MEEMIEYTTRPCLGCFKTHVVKVRQEELDRWKSGTLIQRAMPSLTEDERELMISGTCPECWEQMFSDFTDLDCA